MPSPKSGLIRRISHPFAVDMVKPKAGLEVDIFGETVSAVVAQDVFYDPEGKVLKR